MRECSSRKQRTPRKRLRICAMESSCHSPTFIRMKSRPSKDRSNIRPANRRCEANQEMATRTAKELFRAHDPSAPSLTSGRLLIARRGLLLRAVVMAQNPQCAQCIPAACLSNIRLDLQWNEFGVKQVERPAPVLVAALHHNFDGVASAAVGFDARIAQIIEPAQDIVMPKWRVRKAQPAFVDHLACAQRAEHAALQQIFLTPLPK